MDRDILAVVTNWAEKNESVRAALLTGSRTNPDASVDFLSDYDIELFVDDLTPFLQSDDWLNAMGTIVVRWPHEPPDNGQTTTRLVLYENARIDFQIKKLCLLTDYVQDLPEFYDMGYRVLLDKDGTTTGLKPPTFTAYQTKPPTGPEYDELTKHFWWNVTYVGKYLYRDELFFAKYMLDGALHHEYLQTVLAWYIGMNSKWRTDPGVFGRWFKRYLDAENWADVERTFAGAGLGENWDAMFQTMDVFRRLASHVGRHLDYRYPTELDSRVTAYLQKLRGLSG